MLPTLALVGLVAAQTPPPPKPAEGHAVTFFGFKVGFINQYADDPNVRLDRIGIDFHTNPPTRTGHAAPPPPRPSPITPVVHTFPAPAPVPADVAGTWKAVKGGSLITVTLGGGRLRISGGDPKTETSETVTAEYSVARDGLCYGVITAVEASSPDGRTHDGDKLVDAPFTFRAWADGDVLTLKQFRTPGNEEMGKSLSGTYKRAK